MHQVGRLVALIVIFAGTSLAWFVLSGIMAFRSENLESSLSGAVAELWGAPLQQTAPALFFEHPETVTVDESVFDSRGDPVFGPDHQVQTRKVVRTQIAQDPVPLASTRAAVDLRLDQRRKGLIWFSLFDVTFDGQYSYVHAGEPGTLLVRFGFPQADGFYDDFHVTVDGVERWDVAPMNDTLEAGAEMRRRLGY